MLIRFALQRARTAREAIQVMTSLTEKYGYRSTGETFSIADWKLMARSTHGNAQYQLSKQGSHL